MYSMFTNWFGQNAHTEGLLFFFAIENVKICNPGVEFSVVIIVKYFDKPICTLLKCLFFFSDIL